MSTNAVSDVSAIPTTRPLYWSVRRELWENRSVYRSPLIAAGVILFATLLGTVHLVRLMHTVLAFDPAKRAAKLVEPYAFTAAAIMIVSLVVGVFYCLGALNNERRDRSILFWKSLPVSDVTTVLAKACIPLVVLPLVAFAVTVATQITLLLLSTCALLANGLSAVPLWTEVPLLHIWVALFYALFTLSLWYVPVWGWFLLVSVWAKRVAFLWAFGIPLALCIVEMIAFGTSNVAALLHYRLTGSFGAAFDDSVAHSGSNDLVPLIDPVKFLGNFDLWTGIVCGVLFFAGAVWLRRRRDPI